MAIAQAAMGLSVDLEADRVDGSIDEHEVAAAWMDPSESARIGMGAVAQGDEAKRGVTGAVLAVTEIHVLIVAAIGAAVGIAWPSDNVTLSVANVAHRWQNWQFA